MTVNTRKVASELILVVEDDPFTLSMLTGIISTSEFIAHGERSASRALSFAKDHEPAAVVLDLDLGKGPTGIDLAAALRKSFPRVGLTMLTSYEDPRLLRPNLPDIPNGTQYLVKQKISEQSLLIAAIKNSISTISLTEIENVRLNEFSDIQIETLRLVAQGLSNAEIAKVRYVSEKTVEQTISRLAKQLQIPVSPSVNQRVQLARTYFSKTGQQITYEN